ncbi:metal ABC transporter ATP-binding protein, partial [Paenibacillus sp. 2TAB19]|uniref:metal ABC transporter ATP-binding protein n=1 Tax=Paenibacillus sp. 2TAB19 TaxID=3233003 RepID=UPI003F976C77
MADPALELRDISAGYSKSPTLNQLSFKANQGEFVAITGANGAGKTTLFRTILGQIPLRQGNIMIGNRTIASKNDFRQAQKKIGFVPQGGQAGKLPISVLEALMLGNWGVTFSYCKRPTLKDRVKANEWLAYIGMSDLANQDCRQLSGGQRQRIHIARALIR